MAVSTDPNVLAEASACYNCMSEQDRQSVITYLLATIAGGSTDPATLLEAAECFRCLSAENQRVVQTYLMCQIVNAL